MLERRLSDFGASFPQIRFSSASRLTTPGLARMSSLRIRCPVGLTRITRDGARRKVEFQRADPDGMGAAAVGAPQKRLDAGREFEKRKGLHEIVVRSGGKPAHPVFHGIAGRKHQNGRLVPGFAKAPEERDAVRARKTDVEHQKIGSLLIEKMRARFRVRRARNLVPAHFEPVAQVRADVRIVVDHKNPLRHDRTFSSKNSNKKCIGKAFLNKSSQSEARNH